MSIVLKNNVFGFLQSAIGSTDTAIVLQSGYGASFPTLTSGDYFYATISPTSGASEIVKVVARTGDLLTVVRAQEGTPAMSFAAGSRVEQRVTAQSVLDAIGDQLTSVDRVSQLATVVGTEATNGVTVSGYHSAFDGGGGAFYWDANKPKSAHNGGTVIDPSATFPSNWNDQSQVAAWFGSSNAGNGCWIREYTGAVNARWFGAKGNGLTGTDDTKALQAALDTQLPVYIPTGFYVVFRPLVIQHAHFAVFGDGEYTSITASGSTAAITIGASTGKAVFWIQPAFGNYNSPGWIEGGYMRDMYISGNGVAEGIRFNRVCNGMALNDLRIAYCTKGIHGTYSGWCNSYQHLQVTNCTEHGILLDSYHNAISFDGCTIWGGDLPGVGTDVLLELRGTSIGNSFSGGAIEKGRVGMLIDNSQIAVHGTDFEVIGDSFMQVNGLYSGPSLDFAGYSSSVTSCFFVGTTQDSGFVARGASIQINNCSMLEGSAGPATSYLFKAVAGSDTWASGQLQPCISEFDNVKRGWTGARLKSGDVFSRFTNILSEGITARKLVTGVGNVLPLETAAWDTKLIGKNWIGDVFGLTSVPFNSYELAAAFTGAAGLASETELINGPRIGGLRVYGNDQGTSTWGRSELFTNVTNTYSPGALTASRRVALTGITSSFGSLDDNILSLGTAALRWTEVFAANNVINTSDAALKQQVRSLDEAELAAARQLKGQIKAFKWNDSVASKGDAARIHFGAIAQEVAAVFEANGLNPESYGLFCRDVWYTVDGEITQVDDNGVATFKHYELDGEVVTRDADGKLPDGAIEIVTTKDAQRHERLGLRYEQLLAFIIAAI